jgi:aryl-alcohol dehydrogenase
MAFECLKQKGIAGLIGGSAPGTILNVDMNVLLLGRMVRGIIQGDSVI